MDLTTLRVIVVLALVVALAVLIRQRFGNPYDAVKQAVERATGLPMTVIVRGLGIATLVVWAAVYLFYGPAREDGLESLFKGVADDPSIEPGAR